MRLIDADALLDTLDCSDRDLWTKWTVDDAPTIDAVPVVRCKDCWSAIEIDGFMGGVLYCKFWGHDIEEEWFCSYGERKGGDGK